MPGDFEAVLTVTTDMTIATAKTTTCRGAARAGADELLQTQNPGSLIGSNLVRQAEAAAKVAQGMHEVHEKAELWLAQQLVAVHVTQRKHLQSKH